MLLLQIQLQVESLTLSSTQTANTKSLFVYILERPLNSTVYYASNSSVTIFNDRGTTVVLLSHCILLRNMWSSASSFEKVCPALIQVLQH
jgi:hypothetical protein